MDSRVTLKRGNCNVINNGYFTSRDSLINWKHWQTVSMPAGKVSAYLLIALKGQKIHSSSQKARLGIRGPQGSMKI